MEKRLMNWRKMKMKKLVFIALVAVLLVPALITGCGKSVTTTIPATTIPATTMPDINGGQEAQIIDVTLGQFDAENNMVKNIQLVKPGSLIVRLGSNGTTGYAWGEAQISDTKVVTEASRQFVGPQDTTLVGSGGTEVWVFDSQSAGTATIKISYSRPWEGGEKDTFTMTINVTVK